MPRTRKSNPSKNQKSVVGAWSGGGYASVEAPQIVESCDLCSKTQYLHEQTVEGERSVVCTYCLRVAGIAPSAWAKVKTQRVTVTPPSVDSRALENRLQGRTVSEPHGFVMTGKRHASKRFHHECAYPSCKTKVRVTHVTCADHWGLLTPSLRIEVRNSLLKPNRREVVKKAERYLAIRARLREVAS